MPTILVPILTATPTLVLSTNLRRKTFTIKNDTSSNIYIGENQSVTTSGYHQGAIVSSGGGSVEDRWYKGEVYIIQASGSTLNITVIETNYLAEEITIIQKILEKNPVPTIDVALYSTVI